MPASSSKVNTHELIAFGYIRECQSLLPFENTPYFYIPDLVTIIVSSYIAIAEKWNNELKGNGIHIEGDFENISVKLDSGGYRSVFGTTVINSGCHEWEFKIHKTNGFSYALIIGITKESYCTQVLDSYITTNSMGFGWSASSNGKLLTSGAEGKSYGTIVRSGDRVTMIFNYDEAILKYKVNEGDCGLPQWDKPMDMKCAYRMGVTFYGPHKVEILNYRQTKSIE